MTKEDGKTHSKNPTFGKVFDKLMHDLSITDGAVRLYAHMHWRYGRNKKNFEGQENMAAALGVTEKTIRKRIDELEAKNWVLTINRGRTKKGNWITCFYHVFESQDECRQFRLTYECQEGEEINQKPAARVRKSRKGAGNPNPVVPKNSSSEGDDSTRENSGSDGHKNSGSDDGKNSSSTRRRNLSSDNLTVINPTKPDLTVINPSSSSVVVAQEGMSTGDTAPQKDDDDAISTPIQEGNGAGETKSTPAQIAKHVPAKPVDPPPPPPLPSDRPDGPLHDILAIWRTVKTTTDVADDVDDIYDDMVKYNAPIVIKMLRHIEATKGNQKVFTWNYVHESLERAYPEHAPKDSAPMTDVQSQIERASESSADERARRNAEYLKYADNATDDLPEAS